MRLWSFSRPMSLAPSPRPRPVQPAFEGGQPDWLSRKRSLWLLAGIVVLGAAIRFSTLDQESFWLEEATTWGIASHRLAHVLSPWPKSEAPPPLYYVLLWLWSRVFGTGEVGLRSLSALCGTL